MGGGASTLTPLAGSSSCTFDIVVAAPSDLLYSFKIGTTTYSGPCTAILTDNGGGTETMNFLDPLILALALDNPMGPVTTGFYSGTSAAGKNAQISYTGSISFLAAPGLPIATNLSANITSINSVTRIVQGTFSGTVLDLSATIRTVTNGTFKAAY